MNYNYNIDLVRAMLDLSEEELRNFSNFTSILNELKEKYAKVKCTL